MMGGARELRAEAEAGEAHGKPSRMTTTVVSSAPPVRVSHRDRDRRARRVDASHVSVVEIPTAAASSLGTQSHSCRGEDSRDRLRGSTERA